MIGKLFGPKYTLKDAMQILEDGLRDGSIAAETQAQAEHGPNARAPRTAGPGQMAGGTDIVIPTEGHAGALEICAQILCKRWTDATFEDALTGKKYDQISALPFDRLSELLVYPDAEAQERWDEGSENAAVNSMAYLIALLDSVTIVVDDPATEPMASTLDAIRGAFKAFPETAAPRSP